ncbi:hypothetical protein [Nocardioides zeae]|uniref:Uncharacterized protein n=1 Tax=Nocardioides zeae TaxID=1457234 RepID=A0A6P0HV08_9ACTN|nr:hypothetical protein [Nocardioides zeae]NEN80585.1 hypothetical protein [Nocardioides zeae]
MSVHTTRRRVLATAAWAAPAVAVVSAAPAFAASTANGTFTITRGLSRTGPAPLDEGLDAHALFFNGFTITPSRSSAAVLTLTVTQVWSSLANSQFITAPPGWILTSALDTHPITYVWGTGLTAAQPVAFGPTGSESVYFDDGGSRGDFTLTVTAPGFDSAATVFQSRIPV